jgi:hypothetical protein
MLNKQAHFFSALIKSFAEHPELEVAKDGHLYRCWFPLGDSIPRKAS